LAAQDVEAPRALGALAGGALGGATLGGELALDLRASHGGRALVRRLAALLDEPGGPAQLLGGAGALAPGLAQRALGALAGRVGLGDGADGLVEGGDGRVLGLHRALGL